MPIIDYGPYFCYSIPISQKTRDSICVVMIFVEIRTLTTEGFCYSLEIVGGGYITVCCVPFPNSLITNGRIILWKYDHMSYKSPDRRRLTAYVQHNLV